MVEPTHGQSVSAIFITFSGNCKKALTYYQTCFGGELQFELFGKTLPGYAEVPVVNGSLISDRIIIHGSDLVHSEGRTLGNYMAIFLPCKNADDRESLIDKLRFNEKGTVTAAKDDQKLIEITDAFDVRWVLGV
ncbi:glyoxalase [Parapedobacter sp. 10938]|uniref:glyoxalase n=1 Tax=Parapedobacter flavus TaxID=3110225 RepID=UPI002DBC867E|nr:glyoxalase [Parapedobacter sp. 10938]MEC3881633.1 glyoxalase [Parapedobacter sp. 10938]